MGEFCYKKNLQITHLQVEFHKDTILKENLAFTSSNKNNKHNAKLQRPNPGIKKMWGHSVPRAVFSHAMHQMDFYCFH